LELDFFAHRESVGIAAHYSSVHRPCGDDRNQDGKAPKRASHDDSAKIPDEAKHTQTC
jgi:hypothetical protein